MSETNKRGLPPEEVQELIEVIKNELNFNTSSSSAPWGFNEKILGEIINLVAKQIKGEDSKKK